MTSLGFGGGSNRVTVEIVGDARKLRSEVSASKKATSDFSKNAANDLQLIKKTALGVATGLATIGATVTGIAVKGGVERLMGLERANRQLSQLGVNTGDSKRLMDSLLDSLLGTPFALDKGAASLAGFVASGRDLKDIPRLIQQVTDTAAFGNTTLEEVDFIWQRIQTTGRVTNKELRMLAERNIPVYSQLAAAFGVTGAEVFDMARRSELSADMFFDAWEAASEGTIDGTVRVAGAAKAMGETTEGAWMNMRTAMSRFGATLLEDVFPLAKDLFSAIGEGFDRMGEVISEALDGVDTSNLEEAIDRIPEMMADAAQSVINLWQETKVLRDVAGDVFGGIIEIIKTGWIPALGAALLALKALYAHPVIAGLGAVAWVIGNRVSEAAERADRNVGFLADSLREMSETKAGQALNEWLTPHNIGLLEDMGIEVGEVARMLREGKAGTEEWNTLMGPFIDTYGHWTQEVALGRRETLELVDALEAAAIAQQAARDETEDARSAHIEAAEAQHKAEFAARRLTGATERSTQATEEDIEAKERQHQALLELDNPMSRLVALSDEQAEKQAALNEAVDTYGANSTEAAAAGLELFGVNSEMIGILQKLKDEGVDPTGAAARQMFEDMGIPPAVIAAIFAQFEEIERNAPHIRATLSLPNVAPVSPSGGGVGWRSPGRETFAKGGIVPSRPGGVAIDGLFAEAGQDEAIAPIDDLIGIIQQALENIMRGGDQGRGEGLASDRPTGGRNLELLPLADGNVMNEVELVEALKRWSRRNGPLPFKVTG